MTITASTTALVIALVVLGCVSIGYHILSHLSNKISRLQSQLTEVTKRLNDHKKSLEELRNLDEIKHKRIATIERRVGTRGTQQTTKDRD